MGGSARNRGGGRVKRKEVETEDGWTVVTHGLSNLSLGRGKDQAKSGGEHVSASLPVDIVRGLTPEKLLEDFKKLQERWEDSIVAKQVAELLNKRPCDIDSAVCIGIGSLSRDWHHRWRSLWQLVLFIDVVEHCKSQSTGEAGIKIYAQDPAFTTLDVTFLKELGIQVTETGLENHIGDASFVYSPFVDWYLLLPLFLKGKDPVLYVGNEILDDYTPYGQSQGKRERLDECNELGKLFLVDREMVKLGEFSLHANALNGMVVYRRREDATEKEKEKEEEGEP
ncbi:uncharacterized protein K460DRAFT_203924 [Cucurbitaria berberidis CBS 394.84]|uniref:SRR1-like domain-containing protein n=1 Tax=Cucurbitaria berberidis CBS 394.84 TaxID=1168544 RepID=A0A9P4G742_9PLEO|nr:uncharacterized protein K460DRAFT_203924 [Cucurbitaria berberidis CBS 394.84]KAF1840146.1 hypothetical protein K460DRAFT_203924 [Cucurbitaria berberidis CBS 394.84]